MLKCGGRWADCPAEYGPLTTVYNRWNRWSHHGIWSCILPALTEQGWIAETAQIDSSYIKAHRCAGGAGESQCHWHLAWVAKPPMSTRLSMFWEGRSASS
ncbi:hypothetical protein GCM10011499_19950 [Pelagibacterium lentulum]|uniref:Insertion element IS402-like domain-containing protein n=1 Tax=Pelagibacterium lentulum TaxID=2029865 RepID=A0A916RB42_9HYPH|nr:hypothetical protein GCM10011499_19950 [Pelagibacterium lentulum]